jgi:hypothetical protein
VAAQNVATLAQRYVNGAYHGPLQSGSLDAVRKQFFGYVITALMGKLQSLPFQSWTRVGSAVAGMAARRELFLYDAHPAIEQAARNSGVDGALLPALGDYLFVVDDNRSYNKLGPYIDESVRYVARVRADLSVDANLTLRYHVRPSPPDLEGLGPGAGWWGTKHDLQDFIRVYVPAGARLIRMDNVNQWAPQPAYGLTQFAGRLLVTKGQTRTVTIRYRIPAQAFAGVEAGTYRLTVRRQAGSTLRTVQVQVIGPDGTNPVSRTLPLARDTHLAVPMANTSWPASAPLHGLILSDPYVPFSDFNDPRHPL